MLNELYVDDLINSTSDTTEALQLSEGMNLRRWATNSTTLHEAWKRANIDCRKTSEESGIILLMTDDIANNGENLTPGIVINHRNGNDAYKGVPKDYTGEDVTPKNFMAV
ncbi:legumain [Trichonephila inaurata madagascariensis]|uniref:Legumain n=1 Tax=Trichonephila inaurata madagascariensis TaxID=2747483 RepID=A0A8X6XKU2_9ARAC|nr:legumain [Trichonephila inaurata madagascariensis]GFY57773.1 legumain [Trichonephila inaurata madagascariensis]